MEEKICSSLARSSFSERMDASAPSVDRRELERKLGQDFVHHRPNSAQRVVLDGLCTCGLVGRAYAQRETRACCRRTNRRAFERHILFRFGGSPDGASGYDR